MSFDSGRIIFQRFVLSFRERNATPYSVATTVCDASTRICDPITSEYQWAKSLRLPEPQPLPPLVYMNFVTRPPDQKKNKKIKDVEQKFPVFALVLALLLLLPVAVVVAVAVVVVVITLTRCPAFLFRLPS